MRFKLAVAPKIGDERIVSTFLFFPRRIAQDWRWLEVTRILQIFLGWRYSRFNFCARARWKDVGFLKSDPMYDCAAGGCSLMDGPLCDITTCKGANE